MCMDPPPPALDDTKSGRGRPLLTPCGPHNTPWGPVRPLPPSLARLRDGTLVRIKLQAPTAPSPPQILPSLHPGFQRVHASPAPADPHPDGAPSRGLLHRARVPLT